MRIELENLMMKHVSTLEIEDFVRSPVWSWADADDESLVEPLEITDEIPDDRDAVFVLTNILLSDGTSFQGTLSLRMSDSTVYLLSIPNPLGGFVDVRVGRIPQREALPNILAKLMEKSMDEIYPIRYDTKFHLPNGKQIKGTLALTKDGALIMENGG